MLLSLSLYCTAGGLHQSKILIMSPFLASNTCHLRSFWQEHTLLQRMAHTTITWYCPKCLSSEACPQVPQELRLDMSRLVTNSFEPLIYVPETSMPYSCPSLEKPTNFVQESLLQIASLSPAKIFQQFSLWGLNTNACPSLKFHRIVLRALQIPIWVCHHR